MTALVRNLATMTRVGLLAPGSAGTAKAVAQLGDRGAHPQGARPPDRAPGGAAHLRGGSRRARRAHLDAGAARSSTRSTPRSTRRSSNVEPTGKRLLLALDVSGSMTRRLGRRRAGPDAARRVGGAGARDGGDRDAVRVVGFYAGQRRLPQARPQAAGAATADGITPLAISPRQRLDDAVRTVRDLPFGGTDCALPMLYALDARAGGRHVRDLHRLARPGRATSTRPRRSRDYRRASGIDARLVVVGMVSNGFTIADPNDAGMLDVVGFDTATPQLITDFARGARSERRLPAAAGRGVRGAPLGPRSAGRRAPAIFVRRLGRLGRYGDLALLVRLLVGELHQHRRRAVAIWSNAESFRLLDRVAGLVVAAVVGLAGRAAVDRRLLGGLDPLGAGEQAAGRSAAVDERPVVRAPVERRRLGGEPLRVERSRRRLLDLAPSPPARPVPVSEPSPS